MRPKVKKQQTFHVMQVTRQSKKDKTPNELVDDQSVCLVRLSHSSLHTIRVGLEAFVAFMAFFPLIL